MSPRAHKDDGFTLIEVLASLVIFSVAIVGLIHLNTQSVKTVTSLEGKMLAGIVADNVLIDARRKELRTGENDGRETARGQEFIWLTETRETEVKDFYEIIVSVRDAKGEQVLVERRAYRSTGE